MADITITPLGTRTSQWGEGPLWWNGHLYYVDIEGHAIVQLNIETGKEISYDLGERVGCVVPHSNGGFVYAGDTGIYRIDLESKQKKLLADPEPEKRSSNRFNDGKCDPSGRFWAGTISLTKKISDAALYSLEADGAVQTRLTGVTNSNGLCWSRDQSTMYYIDTPTKKVAAFDFDTSGGDLSNRRVAVDTAALGFSSSPDGMTIDTEGHLWVSFCHGGCVACFNPASGKVLEKIELPAIETTACTFGGAKLDQLLVTTGVKPGIDEVDAGRIFKIEGLGVQGFPASAYTGVQQ